MRRLLPCIAVTVATLLLSTTARAEPGRRDLVLKLRSTGLFAHWETINLEGVDNLAFPIINPTITVELEQSYLVEAGAGALLGLEAVGYDAYARGGWIWGKSGTPAAPGWDTQLVTLAGYRFTKRPPFATSDGYDNLRDVAHCATAMAGLDITRWGQGKVGFTMRIHTGATLVLTSSQEGAWDYTGAPPMDYSLEVGLSIGLALDR